MFSSRFAPSSDTVSSLELPAWIERLCLPVHLLNLDAPLIALLWQHSFSQWVGISSSLAEKLVLASVVWSIYTLDRLLDVSSPSFRRGTARHRFTQRHAGVLKVLVAVTLPFAALLAFGFLDQRAIYGGVIVCGFVLAYFGVVHLKREHWPIPLPKEVLTGVLFAAGTALTALSHPGVCTSDFLPLLPFMMLCILNCFAIEVWESQRLLDGNGPQGKIAQAAVDHLQLLLLLTCFFIFCLLVRFGLHACICSLLFSALAFLWIGRHIEGSSSNLLRLLPDLPLLSPLLFLPLSR